MYRLAVPHTDLLPFIEHYWAVSTDPGEKVDLSVDVYVDARADLVFNFGDPYLRGVTGRRPVTYSVSNLDAQRNVPITIRQRGAVWIAGVRFRVGAALSIRHGTGLEAYQQDSGHRRGLWRDRPAA